MSLSVIDFAGTMFLQGYVSSEYYSKVIREHVMRDFYCPSCGLLMQIESDTQVVYCPDEQIAFSYELLDKLIKMAVDWRDSANEKLHGVAGS